MIARISSPFFLLLISATFVVADASDPKTTGQWPAWVDPGWRRTVARYAVTFDEHGLSTTVFDFEIKALNEKGAEAIAQQTTAYNSYFDEFSASDLATVKADGSVITVDGGHLLVWGDALAPTFADGWIPGTSPGMTGGG